MDTIHTASMQQDNEYEMNNEQLDEVYRIIASALIFSSDGYLLMGRKDPARGGVYPNVWHIPGGGVEEGEELEDAVVREVREEVGLVISKDDLIPVSDIGTGSTIKTLAAGERVWCHMAFHRFEVRLPKNAAELSGEVKPGDDLIELRWFAPSELSEVEQIPGGREFFIKQGYIQ